MPRLSQKLEQKQKLAPRQVLQARLLQLNTLNLEQAILKELELNPILEQVEPEDFEEKSMAEEILEEMDAPIEDVYTDESTYYIEQEKSDLPLPDRTTFIEKIIEQLIGGLKASMGYTGNKNIKDFKDKTKVIKITSAGLNESHVHSISITRESPNYQLNK